MVLASRLLVLKLAKHLSSRHASTEGLVIPSDFKTVYKFPYLQSIGLINRLKLYQTVLGSSVPPAALALNYFEIIGSEEVLFAGILALTGLIPLYSFGYFSNKLIGIVYYNQFRDLVRIAYLDFWGTRKDITIPRLDLMSLSESPRSVTDPLYVKVLQVSSKDTLKLCVKYGIVDKEGFNKVFLSF